MDPIQFLARMPTGLVPVFTVAALLLLHGLALAVLPRILERAGADSLAAAADAARQPLFVAVIPLGLLLAMPALRLEAATDDLVGRVLGGILVAALGWTLVRMTSAAFAVVMQRPAHDRPGTVEARRRITLLTLARRLIILAICLVAVGLILTSIPSVRHIGISLFASAGVAGLIVGIAAQPTLSNLIAGIQIAVTQPIRIGDRLFVEGEFGEVREIGSTYVVLELWDQRRMILPLSYFLQKPFQNWTRDKTELLQSFLIYLDYSTPVAELRAALERIVTANKLWDGRFWNLQVTDFKESSVELRVLLSCANDSAGWDLRCQVREELLAFLRDNQPSAPPRTRIAVPDESQAARTVVPDGLRRRGT